MDHFSSYVHSINLTGQILTAAKKSVFLSSGVALPASCSGALTTVPALMVLGTGMSINNGLAVLRGLHQRGGEFVRTPKSGSTQLAAMASRYKARRNRSMWFVEMLVGAYCLANWAIYLTVDHLAFSIFLGVYAVGYLAVSRKSSPWMCSLKVA